MSWETQTEFWQGRRVFLTGHTGFKGSWLFYWLRMLGAEVHGYSLAPITGLSLFGELNLQTETKHDIGNILDLERLRKKVKEVF